ncbi:MAG: YerC/YecD family TrpR-related protein [Oscillospiraceae bacterium]|nr:YerC/YecD family TrpR-related protein [Oscillospiraceae bacterium]
MNKNIKKPRNMAVYEAITTLETVDECIKLFDDLLSVAELRAMEQRYQVAEMLNRGMVYSAILEKTGASSATISRINRSLQNAGEGYRTAFARTEKNEDSE